MNRIVKILLLTSSIFICSNIAFGQLVSDAYCKEFENTVVLPLNPVHWYSNIVFKDSCRLEFDVDFKNNTGILFEIERYETEKATRKSLHSNIEMYEAQHCLDREKDFKFPKFAKDAFWDEAYFSEGYGPMMLRRKRTFITIFCNKKELCPQIEKMLRDVSVLREF